MKTSFATSSLAAAVAFLALAVIGSSPSLVSAAEADINIVGAKTTPMMRGTRGAKDSGIDTKIATHDILNRATALVNKNTLAMDNNVFVSRSNIVMAQNDRLAMAKKVEALVASAPQMSTTESESETEADEDYHDTGRRADMSPAAAAVLTKNIMTAVGGKDTDAVTMSKASAVVAAKGDANVRAQRIADLVNAVFDAKAQREQMLQTQGSGRRGGRTAAISIGSKDILRQPTGVVNKNMVLSDSQVAISRSTLAPTQNDNIMLDKHAKVATLVAPASAIRVSADVSTDSDDRDSKN